MKAVLKKNILMMAGIMMIVMFCFGANVYGSTPKVNSVVICGNPLNHAYALKIHNMFKSNTYAGYWNNAYPDPFMYFSGESAEDGGVLYTEINQLLDNAFGNSDDNDINIFYYCGHGYKGKQASGYVYGFTLNDGTDADQYYNFQVLAQRLCRNYKGKNLVILDSCFSDSFYQFGVLSLTPEEQVRFTCVASTSKDEQTPLTAYYSKCMASGCGYSTYKKLPADSNSDGYITVREVQDYTVTAAIAAAASTYSYSRVPVRDNAGLSNFSLFNHAELSAIKSNTTAWKTGSTTKIKEAFSVTCNPLTTKREMKWMSSDSTVVSVASTSLDPETGKYSIFLNGKKPGKAIIKGYLVDGMKTVFEGAAIYSINVTVKAPTITLDRSSIALSKGGTYQLKTTTVDGPKKTVTWSSSNTSVATVSSDGVVTAVKIGSATITATANGVSATCKVTVHPFDGGSGTKSDPYLVRTLAQLRAIKNYPKRSFKQTANINGNNATIDALFSEKAPFSGTYNGAGYTISKLKIKGTDNVGLFAVVDTSGTIEKLKLANISATANGKNIACGALVGRNKGTVSRCHVKNSSVSVNDSAINASGGLIGHNTGGVIQNCSATNVSVTGHDVGGVIGGCRPGSIISCHAYSVSITAGSAAGGVLGAGGNCLLKSCSADNKCNIISRGYRGQVIGYKDRVTIE